jgi:hypothetical protein
MTRALLLALSLTALIFGTGINGCKPHLLDVEVVVPPGATSIDDSIVVIVDEKGNTAFVPWNQFRAMDLDDYKTIEEIQAAVRTTP